MSFVATLKSGNELPMSIARPIDGPSNGRSHGQTHEAALPELFVINLCASMTPMPAVPKHLKGFEKYKLYQVSRQEDGRRRFRLRLGFFTSEGDAEWVLNSVRSLYPAAFTGCVTHEDLRYTNDSPPVAAPQATASAVPIPTTAQAVSIQPAPSSPAPVAKPIAAKPVDVPAAPATSVAKQSSLPLTLAKTIIATPTAPATQSYAQPFHVGRGVDLPETSLELTDEYPNPAAPSTPPATAAKSPARSIEQPVAKPPVTAPATAPASSTTSNGPVRHASVIAPPKIVDDYVPILDTTLTIRTLTKAEAEDPNRPKWFAVHLALSEQPINLDTMPKLDIFAAYTLYSVASMEDGTIKHALRLGFFKETVSAEAVMGYLKAFFNNPSLTQISNAEYQRFSEPKPRPKAVEPEANVVNLNGKRPAPATKPAAATPVRPAVNSVSKPMNSATPNKVRAAKPRIPAPPPRPQSFLSRLIGRELD